MHLVRCQFHTSTLRSARPSLWCAMGTQASYNINLQPNLGLGLGLLRCVSEAAAKNI